MAIAGHSSIVANAEAIGNLASFGVQAGLGFQKLAQEKAQREKAAADEKSIADFELNLINDQLGNSSNIQPSTAGTRFNSEIDAIGKSSSRLEMAARQGANPAMIKLLSVQRYKDIVSKDSSLRKEAAESFKLMTGENIGATIDEIVDTRRASLVEQIADQELQIQNKALVDYNLKGESLKTQQAELSYIDSSKARLDYFNILIEKQRVVGKTLSPEQLAPHAAAAMPAIQMLAFETRQDVLRGVDVTGGLEEDKKQSAILALEDAKTRYQSSMIQRSGGFFATDDGKKYIDPGMQVFDNAIERLKEGKSLAQLAQERDLLAEMQARSEVLTPEIRKMKIMGEVFQKAMGDTAGAKILFDPEMRDYRNWLMNTFNSKARAMHPSDLNLDAEGVENGQKVLSDLVTATVGDKEAQSVLKDSFKSLSSALESDPESLSTSDLELIIGATENPDFVEIANDWEKSASRYQNATTNYMGHIVQDIGKTFNPEGSVGLKGVGISWVAPLTMNIKASVSDNGDFLFVTKNSDYQKHADSLNRRYGRPLSRVVKSRAHAINKNTDYKTSFAETMDLLQLQGGFQFKLEGAEETTTQNNEESNK